MANEVKKFIIGGVEHPVQDDGARQLIAQLQAAIDAITSGDTTTAIKTFQEVIAFLDGVTDDSTLIGKLNELRTLISAKYSKPASGIPASDLAPAVQTSLGLADTALQAADKAQLQAAINAVQTALNNLMNGQNVTDAIDTFNEVVDFLANVNNDETLLGKLQQLQTQINSKANDNAVVKSISVNGTAQTKDGNGNVNIQVQTGSTISPATAAPSMDGNTALVGSSAKYAREDHVHPHDSTKQNTLTFDDAPTAGSNNPVKSGGVKTALDAKANTADVPTKTEMADAIDDALGEAQVTVVPEGSVGVISSLGSDSNSDALSASMGKKLKVAIITILNSLGNYAFPGGKPVIDWGDDTPVTYTVSKTIGTGLSASGGDTSVDYGDSLEVTISITNNLYVIDDDNVEVIMGGSPLAGAWNASTKKVHIAAVTGNVVINVPSMTYVSSGLVLMFDGKNQGETAGQWQDLANTSRSVALTGGYTKNSDNVQFDGTGYGSGNFVDNVVYNQSTVECVINQSNKTTPSAQVILLSGKTGAPTLGLFPSGNNIEWSTHVRAASDTYTARRAVYNWTGALSTKYSVSYYGNTMLQNGQKLTAASASSTFENAFNVNNHKDKTFVGAQITGANAVLGFNGKIYCVRMYSRVLTDAEAFQNWKVDQKRFNI